MTGMLLLRGGLVLDPDPMRGFAAADVLIDGERVAAVGPGLTRPDGAEVRDLAGGLVMPGLINAHAHSPYLANISLVDEEPLELWSLANGAGRGAAPTELGLWARLSAAEMLLGGVTSVVDMVRLETAAADEGLDAIAEGYVEAGIRAAIAPVVADLRLEDTIPLATSGNPIPIARLEDQLELVGRFHARWHGRAGRIAAQVGPSGPQRCSDPLYAGCVALARRLGTRLHTHALETAPQREQAQRRWGRPMLEHLAELDLLGSETVLAHLVWPTPGEIELVARAGAMVVHNPASNRALGSGRMPLPELLRAGARVALGTDAASCNDGLSMFEAMKWAAILHRPFTPDWHDWPHPTRMLQLATAGGAAALGRDDLGVVAPGRLADLVVLDRDDLAFVPPNDLARQTVMRGHPGLVRDVLVGGQTVVRDRRLVTLDVPALVEQARTVAQRDPNPSGSDQRSRPEIEEMLLRPWGGQRPRDASGGEEPQRRQPP